MSLNFMQDKIYTVELNINDQYKVSTHLKPGYTIQLPNSHTVVLWNFSSLLNILKHFTSVVF